MPGIRRLVVVGILTILAGLVILFPARAAIKWFAPDGVAISGISGTVWRGNARHMQVRSAYAGNVSWRIRPLLLFTGKLAYNIEADPGGGFVNGQFVAGIGGAFEVNELSAALPLKNLESAVGVRGLGGNASARFDRIVIDNGVPVAADGFVEVAGLVLPAVGDAAIGGYRADFYTQQTGVVAAVEDTDGEVDLAGRLTISANGAYEFVGKLAPKANTSEQVLRQMEFLGSADERGQRELRLEGSL